MSWKNGFMFKKMKVPTIDPVLYLEKRVWGVLLSSYIAFPYIEKSASLLDAWPNLDEQRRYKLILALAEIFGKMHSMGLYHGDLNWRNILVQDHPNEIILLLIDLDRSVYKGEFNKKLASNDLSHFYRDMERNSLKKYLRQEFQVNWDIVTKN